LYSPSDLPPSDNSAMDGYAILASDVASLPSVPSVPLRLLGEQPAGHPAGIAVTSGACLRIFTGAMLPPGADAVVMQEDTQPDPRDPSIILILDKVTTWENVRFRGEDVKKNALLLKAGELLTAQRLSLLAAAGISRAQAHRQPVVGLIATGDELREAGQPLTPGQIYESNRLGLSLLARQAGAIPRAYPLLADDLELTQQALRRAFAECDVVITSGGVSVGEKDWVKKAFAEIGGELDLWTVAIRPGKPFAFGRYGGKLLFGLPGNPVSALVTFFLLARPALLRLQGASDVHPPVSLGNLSEPLSNPTSRRHFMRVILDSSGQIKSAGPQGSHILSSMAQASGLVDLPPETTWQAGALAPVLRWS
ncbi:MAG TPA: gephyrin-like molybdotransferase Glp, partial [Candidatus Saccharimonadales bacterium]|nr:gephyrin-like molybdotransferase Glp [Candidatus Saccharimonadales bacterium]